MTMKLYTYAIEIVRVVDGDTLEADIDLGFNIVAREFIRLYDVDTPEVYGRYAEPAGALASQFTKDWLEGQTGLILDSRRYDARGKYGRCLGEIFRPDDPVSLNDALIHAGHVKGTT